MNVVLVYLPKTRYYFIGMSSSLDKDALSKVGASYNLPEFLEYTADTPIYRTISSDISINECREKIASTILSLKDTSKCLNLPETEWPLAFKPFKLVECRFTHIKGTRLIIFRNERLIISEDVGVSPEDLSKLTESRIIGSFCTLQDAENKARSIINRKSRKRK